MRWKRWQQGTRYLLIELPRNSNADPVERKQRQQHHAAFVAFCGEAEADKESITVTGVKGADFGIIEPGEEPHLVHVKIRKTDPAARIMLHKFSFSSHTDEPQKEEWGADA